MMPLMFATLDVARFVQLESEADSRGSSSHALSNFRPVCNGDTENCNQRWQEMLVGGFNPSEKYWSIGMMKFPTNGKYNSCSSHHQPE